MIADREAAHRNSLTIRQQFSWNFDGRSATGSILADRLIQLRSRGTFARRAYCHPSRRSLLLGIAFTLSVASPALAKVESFYSPSKNISCEVSSGGKRGAAVPTRSASRSRSPGR